MTISDYLQEVLHQIASALMLPVIIVLVLLILVSVFCIGSIIVEFFAERRHFKVQLPRAINDLEAAPYSQVNDVICSTRLLWQQKAALLTVANNAGLPEDALYSIAKGEVSNVDTRNRRTVGITELLTKVSPMMGLMATLIPLGPGIVAMGQGQVDILSASLGVAFDGTVAGLLTAVVCMCVSHIRKRWYQQYLTALESMMTTLLEKIELERAACTNLPTGFTADQLEPFREQAKLAAKGAK
ncbi:MAG: MotA/TolQ/ExbB proton channel family protein [Coriobacteriia bacterium]|nr:MotA/TolQ/ExbB proton channel family protein [Coriobacteriia bacterium]